MLKGFVSLLVVLCFVAPTRAQFLTLPDHDDGKRLYAPFWGEFDRFEDCGIALEVIEHPPGFTGQYRLRLAVDATHLPWWEDDGPGDEPTVPQVEIFNSGWMGPDEFRDLAIPQNYDFISLFDDTGVYTVYGYVDFVNTETVLGFDFETATWTVPDP